ncbi:mannose-1-phosphate guanylyltransferase/mannose-6-phosphate isomerase [Neptunicella sp. SCSIO 80796]|uniref:mannose-1-phosphate guanylyltransferase/mannose-6-phosphate isomerase n=1 Tax=Neptunicella plasticusilytica TaxID=3117012 RepID=UPI003A4E2C75
MLVPVIMCGGSGTRMWPLSREHYPKQFLNLVDPETSLLQATVKRLSEQCAPAIAITNEQHRFLVAEQFRMANYQADSIILEPEGRNTAPAVAIAAFKAIQKGEDPVLLVLASDHHIADTEVFRDCVEHGQQLAQQGKLVTFGIVPTTPETGYGYIKQGKAIDTLSFELERFVEKPDWATAESYLESGDYLWNSGMFMFKASTFLAELKRFRPDIFAVCEQACQNMQPDLDFIRLDREIFSTCPSESIDYAVMEKTSKGVTLRFDAGWCDVGSWSALWELQSKDDEGNYARGDVFSKQSRDCYVLANKRLVTTLGVEDLIIIDTDDALLVANKHSVQDIKQIVNHLQQTQRPEAVNHRKVYRPWGSYDSVDDGPRFQVKRITVKPGEKISTQMHHHRAEHWIVVSGTAKVTKNGASELVSENQSTYIPIGVKHGLENPGQIPLEMIEVQSGQYFGEDDIIRFEDTNN